MPTTIEHANLVIQRLVEHMEDDGVIPNVGAVTLIEACGYKAGAYGVAYGQAISLLDAACLLADLPWLGRLVVFAKKRNDLLGPWKVWGPHMAEIVKAPTRKHWSKMELERISETLPAMGAAKWWREHRSQSEILLQRALAAARR